ncbi:MAG TPA: hypothetical protein PKZ75_06500 [Bacteroidia bacterium]|nr:hypothetical protein [Bacteroidia bacterium]
MSKLIFIFFIITNSLLFSQNEGVQKIKITKEKTERVTSIKELINSIPSDYNVTFAEYTYYKNGKIFQEIAYNNTIPNALFNNNFPKGTTINVFVKILQDTKTATPKSKTIKTKITIE